jgi:hypothetical protein
MHGWLYSSDGLDGRLSLVRSSTVRFVVNDFVSAPSINDSAWYVQQSSLDNCLDLGYGDRSCQ